MNGKTILLVGGVAVGVVVLFKLLSPSPAAAAPRPSSGTDVVSLNSLFSLGASIFNAFGSSGSGSYPNQGTYHANASTFQVQGNQLIDPSTGGAVVYGTD